MQVLYSLASADTALQQRTAAALARLVKDADLRLVFIERKGLDILLEPLKGGSKTEAQLEAAGEAPCCWAAAGLQARPDLQMCGWPAPSCAPSQGPQGGRPRQRLIGKLQVQPVGSAQLRGCMLAAPPAPCGSRQRLCG